MKWGLKGGISIDADSGPPRYVLWCCDGICHQVLTFFKIGSGYTVRWTLIKCLISMLSNLAETLNSSAKWKNKQAAKIWSL